jgi:hypothetical protein
MAIFSPLSVQAGVVSVIVTSPPLSAATRPPHCEAPMLMKSVSPTASFETLAFFESSVLTPSNLRSRKTDSQCRIILSECIGLTLGFDFSVDGGTLADLTHDHTHETITSAKSGIDHCSNTNKTTWDSVLELVLLSEECNDT